MTATQTTIAELTELWQTIFPTIPAPDTRQFAIWLLRFQPYIVRQGIANLALKADREPDMDLDWMYRYASASMANIHNRDAAKLAGEYTRRPQQD